MGRREGEPSFLSVLLVSVLVFIIAYVFSQTYLNKKILEFQRDHITQFYNIIQKQVDTLSDAVEKNIITREDFIKLLGKVNEDIQKVGVVVKHKAKELDKKLDEKVKEIENQEIKPNTDSVVKPIQEKVTEAKGKISDVKDKVELKMTEVKDKIIDTKEDIKDKGEAIKDKSIEVKENIEQKLDSSNKTETK